MPFFSLQTAVPRFAPVARPRRGACSWLGADGASAIVVDLGSACARCTSRALPTSIRPCSPRWSRPIRISPSRPPSRSGDELFETVFNALDGVGANVGNGQRFTRMPARGSARREPSGSTIGPRARRVRTPRTATPATTCPSTTAPATLSANVHRDPLRGGCGAADHPAQHAAPVRARRGPAPGGGDDRRTCSGSAPRRSPASAPPARRGPRGSRPRG